MKHFFFSPPCVWECVTLSPRDTVSTTDRFPRTESSRVSSRLSPSFSFSPLFSLSPLSFVLTFYYDRLHAVLPLDRRISVCRPPSADRVLPGRVPTEMQLQVTSTTRSSILRTTFGENRVISRRETEMIASRESGRVWGNLVVNR